jgi:hypothetical protein
MPTTRSAQKKTKIVIAKKKRGVKHKKISSTSKKSTIKDKLTNIEESIKKIGNEPEFNQTHSNENVILTTKVSSSTQDDKIYNVRLVSVSELVVSILTQFLLNYSKHTKLVCLRVKKLMMKLLK